MRFGVPKPLTDLAGTCWSARFAPDGRRIILAATVGNGFAALYLLEPDAGTRERLSESFPELRLWDCHSPMFDESGQRVVCIGIQPAPETDDAFEVVTETFEIDLVAKTVHAIPGSGDPPEVSPDGIWIAYRSASADRLAHSSADIYRMNADGSNVVRLTFTEGDKSEPLWRPGMGQVIFASNVQIGPQAYSLGIGLAEADGSGIVRWVWETTEPGYGYFEPVAVHPDGRFLLLNLQRGIRYSGQWRSTAFLLDLDTGERHALLEKQAFPRQIAQCFSPNGASILLIAERHLQEAMELYRVSVV